MKKINLALLSPSENAYSETFIQAHKNLIDANVSYYFGNSIPIYLEGKGPLQSVYKKGFNKLIAFIKNEKDWDLKQALKNSFKSQKIEVVLAEYGTVASRVLSVCKTLKIPLITHFHGYDASIKSVIQLHHNYTDVFNYSTAIISVSNVMSEQLIKLGCPKEKITLNPCVANDLFQDITPQLNKELFIGVGRFTDKKAPYYTILAFSKVVNEFPNAQLIIGGDGALRNTCLNLVKLHHLEKNVQLPGIITPEQYRKYLQNARAFVQHSITAEDGDMEGTPVAVVEASSAGIPVISTFHAGIPDVIINGETGFLVNEHDIEDMAEQMLKFLRNKNLAIEMGETGKKFIKTNFSMEKHINTLSVLIQNSK